MGVAGSGKSTLGAALAERLGRPFLEGDDYHPPANVAKMASGTALADADREGWIAALCAAAEAGPPAVVACSALNPVVRGWIAARCRRPVRYVHLAVDRDTLRKRLEARDGHFMGAGMLEGQLAALDPPTEAIRLPGDLPLALLVDRVVAELGATSHD